MRPSILLLHGLYGTPASLSEFGNEFKKRGWNVVTPDLRNGSARCFNDFVETAKHDFSHMRSENVAPIVIGHSMGGLIGQVLAGSELNPRALVLISSAPPAGIPVISWNLLKILPFHIIPMLTGEDDIPSFEEAESLNLNGIPVKNRKTVYDGFHKDSGRIGREIMMGIKVGKINCPVLCLSGVKDQFVPLRVTGKIAARYEAQLAVYPGRGHLLPIEEGYEKVASDIDCWLTKYLGIS